jgi:hypothetical protein
METKDICNNVSKRIKLHAERQREYRETHKNISAEYMHNYRRLKAQEKALLEPVCVCHPIF